MNDESKPDNIDKARRLMFATVAMFADRPLEVALPALNSAAAILAMSSGVSKKDFMMLVTASWDHVASAQAQEEAAKQAFLAAGLGAKTIGGQS